MSINAQINQSTKIVAKHVTLHNATKDDVGLGNVSNTSDIAKPISAPTQSALDLKADQSTTYTKTEVNTNIANLVNSAPGQLDTLAELSAALGNDDDFAANLNSYISTKADQSALNTHTADTTNPHQVTATQLSLENVTNESKATMFTDPTFTGTVSGITPSMVQLGSVTNESKATMFDGAVFTGDLTADRIGIGTNAPSKALDVVGTSKFSEIVKITPVNGLGLQLFSSGSNNAAVSLQVQGPTTVGHDLFQRSGFTDGFADGSNHFHSLIDINLIEQQAEGDVKNTQRVQERYYAIQDNLLPNDKAVFWAQHRVARPIDTTIIDTSTATLDVRLLQSSTNRNANNQAFFSTNTSPVGRSEEIEIALNSHGLVVGNNVRMEFSQAFVGPVVAAQLFGVVTSSLVNEFKVALYGGNYKTTSEVPLGTSQTALTFDHVVLETIGTNTIVQSGNESDLQLYSKTNFTPNRLKDETLKATWSVAHGLVKNEHCTLITDERGDLEVKQAAYVLDPDPDSDGLSVILVYGRRIKQFDLGSFTAFGSSNWTLHKGSIDGIHDDTLGDNLINFNANNHGDYTAYQIGPGSQTDADCIAIGKNVYNKDASTIKIGYDNAMLNIDSAGIDVAGTINATGNITGTLGTASQPNITSVGTLTGLSVSSNVVTIDNTNATLKLGDTVGTELKTSGDGFQIFDVNSGSARINIPNSMSPADSMSMDAGAGTFDITANEGTNIGAGDLHVAKFTGVDTTSKLGIRTKTPTEALDVVGNIKASGSITGATLAGTLSTTDQPNIESVGTLASLAVTGDLTLSSALKFGASGKELKEYDYGTFTPKLALKSTSSIFTEQSTHAVQEGYYVKIGRLVTINIIMSVTHFDTAFKTAPADSQICVTGIPHTAQIAGSEGPDTMIVNVDPRKGFQNLGGNAYNGSISELTPGSIFFEKNMGQGRNGPVPGGGVGWNYERIEVNDFHFHPFDFTGDGVKAFAFQISGTYITDDDV